MLKQTDQVSTIRESNPGRAATSGAPTDPTKGLTTKRSTHPSVVESRRTDPSDVKPGRADVSEGPITTAKVETGRLLST